MTRQPGRFVDINEAKHALQFNDKQTYSLSDYTLIAIYNLISQEIGLSSGLGGD